MTTPYRESARPRPSRWSRALAWLLHYARIGWWVSAIVLVLDGAVSLYQWSAAKPLASSVANVDAGDYVAGMTLLSLIVTLIIVGLLLWAVGQLPIDATIQRLIRVVVIVIVVLWLVSVLFGEHSFHGLNVRL